MNPQAGSTTPCRKFLGRLCVIVCASCASPGANLAQPLPPITGVPAAPNEVEIRPLGPVTAEARLLIAELFEPRLVRLRPGQDPIAVLQANCGSDAVADPGFRSEFERQNPGGNTAALDRGLISIPACLRPSEIVDDAPPLLCCGGAVAAQPASSGDLARAIQRYALGLEQARWWIGAGVVQQAQTARDLTASVDRVRRAQMEVLARTQQGAQFLAAGVALQTEVRSFESHVGSVASLAGQLQGDQQQLLLQVEELARSATRLQQIGDRTWFLPSPTVERALQLKGVQQRIVDQQTELARGLPELAARVRAAEPVFQNPNPTTGQGAGALRDQIVDLDAQSREFALLAARLERDQLEASRQIRQLVSEAATLPVKIRPSMVSLTFQPRSGVTPAEAAARLQAVAPATQPSPVVGLSLVTPLTADAAEVTGTPCAQAQPPDTWPLDQRLVADALRVALRAAAERGQHPAKTVVRVADTGVRGLLTFFPQELLAQDEQSASPLVTLPEETWEGYRYGFAAGGRGASVFPYPENVDRYHWHGTQVADLILGGAGLRAVILQALPQGLIGLNFAKLSQRVAGGGQPRIDSGALQQAFEHQPPAFILNASVGTQERLGSFITLAGNNRSYILVVVAAGNEGRDLARAPTIYPAAYGGGGDLGRTMITVGAHDPSLRRAQFSNFSRRYVDLLAPGCAIPFRFGTELSTQLHGTSFAAPLVSFAAATIRAFGVSSPERVKQHILRTTDFDPALERDVLSSGRLNVPKAILAVFYDVLHQKDGSLLPGMWSNRVQRIPCGEGSGVPLREARAVAITQAQGRTQQLRILTVDVEGRFDEPTYCPLPSSPVVFRPADGSDEITRDWGEILGIVPAALQR
jgi:hypothetical protein